MTGILYAAGWVVISIVGILLVVLCWDEITRVTAWLTGASARPDLERTRRLHVQSPRAVARARVQPPTRGHRRPRIPRQRSAKHRKD